MISESLYHLFVACEVTKKHEYFKQNFIKKHILPNSLELLKFKRRLTEDDYGIISED